MWYLYGSPCHVLQHIPGCVQLLAYAVQLATSVQPSLLAEDATLVSLHPTKCSCDLCYVICSILIYLLA